MIVVDMEVLGKVLAAVRAPAALMVEQSDRVIRAQVPANRASESSTILMNAIRSIRTAPSRSGVPQCRTRL
jgi:hypothetical protein